MSQIPDDDTRLNIPGYRLIEAIGQGGMGQVFLAMQTSLQRHVAIKVLDSEIVDSCNFRERFDREANLMAQASHPHVVPVIEKGVIEGRLYIVMEYFGGGNLRSRLRHHQPMPLGEAQSLLSNLGSAVAALHERGIIHRDLKPENILLDDSGVARITDFGVAIPPDQSGPLTAENVVPGTLEYMSPEQQYRLDVDERTDQYALAFLAYETLTGHRPLGIIGPPSTFNTRLTTQVDRVILRGLAEDPDDRFASVEEFSAALDRSLTKCRQLRARGNSIWRQVAQAVGKPAAWFEWKSRPTWQRRLSGLAAFFLLAAAGVWITLNLDNDRMLLGEPQPASPVPKVLFEQIGALAFRQRDGAVEVLIVRTRRDSHWTVPKATRGRHMSVGETVVREAYREAGVRGAALAVPVGSYIYTRNEQSYRVTVYPLRVEKQLMSWPEESRVREWHSTAKAARLVASKGLRALIRDFPIDLEHLLESDNEIAVSARQWNGRD